MLDDLLIVVYNLFFAPVFILLGHVAALFHPKVRAGIRGRYVSAGKIRDFMREFGDSHPELFLIHCASMGEFEHIKPLIAALKENQPKCRIVVMFFSPSGYENVRSHPGVDLFIYAPFDFWWPVRRLFQQLSPRALLISKHDVWPDQVWVAHRQRVPIFLINASLHAGSAQLRFPLRMLNRRLYRQFTRILAISPEDGERFRLLVNGEKVRVVGDTKYDQVFHRAQESRKMPVLPEAIYRNRPVFVAGSTWPEDESRLLPALEQVRKHIPDLLTIICPHEPTEDHLDSLEEALGRENVIRFSRIDASQPRPFILIDRVGILANLYSLAQVAYVGGSFKQNIHNVLEPAAYGIPILFGPVNQNSHEAQLLKSSGAAIEVRNSEDIAHGLLTLFTDEKLRTQKGQQAYQVARRNSGATQKIVTAIFQDLSIHPLKGVPHP
ncbi:MAG: hypothetical protein GXO78_07685 [Calditrichaeota bacterium]|nr:hypothetical protein [Calditrichota bacterium]